MTSPPPLGLSRVIVAPMAGGPTTVELLAAAGSAGALGFVAGAYLSAADLEAAIRATARAVPHGFGVNVFVPGHPCERRGALDRYLHALQSDADHLGVAVGAARWDDDDWDAKLDVLVAAAPALVSFTFGCPPDRVVAALGRAGTAVMVTVTGVAEADAAVRAGADVLCAQGIEAGAHRGTFDDTAADDELPTLDLVRAITTRHRIPVVAAGAIATPAAARAALAAGAVAVQAGTAFLLTHEAGTNPVHRGALVDARFEGTALTRAFTGRRARGLVNEFVRRHADAPSAFPEIHHATRPLRAAAVRAGDPEQLNLWAGTAYRDARAEPAATIVDWLQSELPA